MRCRIRRRRVTRRDVTPVTRDHRHERSEHAGGPPPPAAGHLGERLGGRQRRLMGSGRGQRVPDVERSEEHTSELQSLAYLVCRLLLEKKKKKRGVRIVVIRMVGG